MAPTLTFVAVAVLVVGTFFYYATRRQVDWCVSCGHYFLMVDGIAVAMEADVCRDSDLVNKFGSRFWTSEMIKFMVDNPKEVRRICTENFK